MVGPGVCSVWASDGGLDSCPHAHMCRSRALALGKQTPVEIAAEPAIRDTLLPWTYT